MIPVLVGPTASGKSAVAFELARLTGGEIVNADSRQIYKHLDEGTAKPSAQDRKKIPHHLYDFLEPSEPYNAGAYAKQARETIRGILSRGKTPVVAGGTGLYIQALFDGLADLPKRDEEIRKELERIAEEKGRKFLHELLEKADPVSAQKIPAQNIHRVIRALEVYRLTGKPLSDHHKESGAEAFDHPPALFGVLWEREALRKRIFNRTQQILPALLVETQKLIDLGFKPTDPACESLGYRQAFLCLGKKISREELFQEVLLDTYHYAKRQSTWFRRDPRIRWIAAEDPFDAKKTARSVFDIISRGLMKKPN